VRRPGTVDTATITTGLAAVGGNAAAASARSSSRSVTLAHRPFVVPLVAGFEDVAPVTVRVRLENSGPGVAYDVRVTVRHPQPGAGARRVTGDDPTPPIRAMRAGETSPAIGKLGCYALAGPADLADPWTLAVRYTDASGTRWHFEEPQAPDLLSKPARPLRCRWWQLWRERAAW